MGSLKNEKNFSTLTRFQNRLCQQLNLVFCMYVQPFYMVDIFHYDYAITSRIEKKNHESVFWRETLDRQFSDNVITYNLLCTM